HPRERLDYIIEDSSCEAVLVTASALESLREINVPTLKIEELLHNDITSKTKLPTIDPYAVAYVINTPGSTGKPKGGMVNRQMLHSVASGGHILFIRGGKQPTMVSHVFDIFLFELFHPLLAGGTAMLVSDEVVRFPELLLDVL